VEFEQGATRPFLAPQFPGHIGFNDGCAYRVHSKTFWSKFERDRFRESDNGSFTSAVDGRTSPWAQSEYGGVVHDSASAGLEDCWDLMFHAEKDTANIDVHDQIVNLLGSVHAATPFSADSCIIKRKIQPAKMF
jgi:hypothetical protein